MERLTPGAVLMDLEQLCDDHGRWEDFKACVACDVPVCALGDDECEKCREEVASECQCPGEREVGPCHCAACVAA